MDMDTDKQKELEKIRYKEEQKRFKKAFVASQSKLFARNFIIVAIIETILLFIVPRAFLLLFLVAMLVLATSIIVFFIKYIHGLIYGFAEPSEERDKKAFVASIGYWIGAVGSLIGAMFTW